MEADQASDFMLGPGHGFSRTQSHFKRTNIVLHPDHDAAGSFANPMKNPKLDSELRNNTEVNLNLGDGKKYTWLDGKPVEEK